MLCIIFSLGIFDDFRLLLSMSFVNKIIVVQIGFEFLFTLFCSSEYSSIFHQYEVTIFFILMIHDFSFINKTDILLL